MPKSQVDVGTYSLKQGNVITGYVVAKLVSTKTHEYWYLRKPAGTNPWIRPGSANTNVTVTFVRISGATTTPPSDISNTIGEYDLEHFTLV